METDDPYDLQRFVAAQDARGTYQRALAELRAGRKTSHWMWFVFPQIAGLGYSPTSRTYAITSLAEARAYLAHPVLGGRLTEEQARRCLVPSQTTLLGLVKHVTYAERVWFGEAVTGRPRQEMGLPPNAADAFILTGADTIGSVRRAHADACEESRRAAAGLDLDDVLRGHRFGPLPLRWVYLHALREFAQHCGHADILREQILSGRSTAADDPR